MRDQIERAGYRGAVAGMRTLGDRFHMQRISVYRSMTVLELKTELEGSWVAGF